MEKQDLFYVGIQHPVELRKDLLTSSKTLLGGLKRYEDYQELRTKKFETLAELKRVFDELLVLNRKFRSKLPKVPQAQQTQEAQRIEKRKFTPPAKPIKKSHLDILEDELSKIEKRLESLR